MLKAPTRLICTVRVKASSECGPSLPSTLAAGPTPAQLISLQPAEAADGQLDRRAGVGLAGDVGLAERDPRAEFGGQRLALGGADVGDDDVRAAGVEGADGGFTEARRRR